MATTEEPSYRNVIIGSHLRRLRESQGMSMDEAADAMKISRAAGYRRESGHASVGLAEAEKFVRLYGAENTQEGAHVIELASASRIQGWWGSSRNAIPQAEVADLEDMSSEIRQYEPMLVSGLLQCESYSDALFQPERERLSEMGQDPNLLVQFRNDRKKILDRENRPEMHFVMTEAVLHYIVGGPGIMREQADHLISLIRDRGMDIRIIPFGVPYISHMARSFLLAAIGTENPISIVHLEGSPYGELVDNAGRVDRFAVRFDLLSSAALSPEETAAKLESHTW